MADRGQTSLLVGRAAELSRLIGLVRDVAAGQGHAILVEGEPGIGKSTLMRAVCAVARRRDCAVFWGAGDELGQALPLLPLLDALRVHDAGDDRRASIVRLLRGEQTLGGADPAAAASEQLLALVGELCAASPVVLVVDDLQWADRATVAVWARLSRLARRMPLLLVGMTRPVPSSDELLALRRAAADADGLQVRRLADPAVVELVAAVAGGKPGEDLLRLTDGAAGNPLFLIELVDALARDDALLVNEAGIVELVGSGVPSTLAAAIAHRLEYLPGWVREVLRAASLLGVEFSVSDLAVVLNRRVTEFRAALDEALAARVLRSAGESLAFRHPLIRKALYEDTPAAVRAAWHRDAARALAEAGAAIHQVARQLVRALRLSGAELLDDWLVEWLVGAASALVAQSPGVAVELLRRAVAARSDGVLACRLAEALFRTGDRESAERVAAHALSVVTEPDLLVDLQWTLAQCRAMAGRTTESLAALEHALSLPGIDPGHRARLRVLIARAQRDLGEVDTASRFAGLALAEAEEVGDRWALGWALHVLIIVSVMRGEVGAALPLFERALAVTDGEPGLVDLRLLVQINQAVALGDLDRYDEAIAAGIEVRGLAERTGSLVRLAQAHSALGELFFDVGRWDEALVEVSAVREEFKDPGVACCDHGVAAVISFHRGDLAAAREQLELVVPFASRIGNRVVGSLALARSLDWEQQGALGAALAALTDGVARGSEELEEMEDLLPDAVRLAVELGELPTANELVARAEELGDRSELRHRSAAAAYCRGVLDGDPDTLLVAAQGFQDADRPLPAAKALAAAAMEFAGRGATGPARTAFTAADGIYTALGAAWDTARLRSRLRDYGIRRGPQARHTRATSGWSSLTPAELTVANLVADGLSNPQIAARLFLSPRTVSTHVSHILAKLGVRSRIDVARQVGRMDAAPGPERG